MEKTIPTTIRINESLKQQLEEIAVKEDRSLNNLINIALKKYVIDNNVSNNIPKQ